MIARRLHPSWDDASLDVCVKSLSSLYEDTLADVIRLWPREVKRHQLDGVHDRFFKQLSPDGSPKWFPEFDLNAGRDQERAIPRKEFV